MKNQGKSLEFRNCMAIKIKSSLNEILANSLKSEIVNTSSGMLDKGIIAKKKVSSVIDNCDICENADADINEEYEGFSDYEESEEHEKEVGMSRSICGGLERTLKDLEIVFKTLLSDESREGVTKYASAEFQENFFLFCSASDELRNLIPTYIVTELDVTKNLSPRNGTKLRSRNKQIRQMQHKGMVRKDKAKKDAKRREMNNYLKKK